ncbi:TonB-linked SusC/RagA family outer membrane protein [Parabacteroides sp. PFB2-12]|uniref:SusC/RagA family TonB-linked outer membrane protein n=1 Tax=unclassified Parabacteroides TaxID=2649774 RepID=UPI0024766048|nr:MULTISPECIES: TonB-dependent receptor [unclassified Parabacteroides]MDH6341802.1 TonB-linked SusC/RagA family outer membrane protein [Parabacteroides sp. PM6-13]MDH6392175.1 TonB-linked SusC/RagA family outer membrane protein [Parabacteroides sp. PFB2-12]
MKHKLILFLLLLCSMQYVVAQSVRVTGTIQDEEGEPVIGATIQVKGTSQGTISDYDGKFELQAAQNATLLISYVGMVAQELKVSPSMRIVMAADSKTLDEVIVVAYGQQRKEAITGAVSNLKSEAIERRPIASATAALEGQALGVQVNNSYGEPGAEATIRIRGFTSVNGSNAPLYVVNGVPMGGSMSDINPADIESLTVLKDASSAALYGNKAASGVILVTTKSGRIGEEAIRINANISQGWYQRAMKDYKRLDAKQYMEAYWESNRNALYTGDTKGKYNTYTDANADALEVVRNGVGENYNIFNKSWDNLFDANGKIAAGTEILDGYKDDLDWYDPIERTGNRSQYGINASGGTKKGAYYMSLGYLNEEGFMKKSSGERLTANLKVDVKPTSWLKMGSTINASTQYYNSMTGDTDSNNSYINPFYFARNMAPIYPVHLHDPATGAYVLDLYGNQQYDSGSSGRGQNSNRHIVWETELNQDKKYRTTVDGTAYADIMLPYNFTVTLKGNMNMKNYSNKTYNNAIIGDGAGSGGRMSKTDHRYRTVVFQQLVNWHQTFKEKHSVEVLVGHESFSRKYDYDYNYKTGEKFANMMELSNFATMSSILGYQEGYKTEGFLSRAAYNYDQTYFVEGSFRRDGSSRFHKDHRWGNFWSLGGSWIASNEAFIRQFEWIDYLKLRAGYGEVGQEASVDYYAWMGLYNSTVNGGNGAYYKYQNEALDITWETSRSASFALETNLFKRLNLSVEYYQRGSSNLLFDVNLPASMGSVNTGKERPTVTKNFGTLVNKGWEIGIDGDIVKTKDFNWNLGVNINTLKNKIKKLPVEYGGKGSINGTKRYFEGHSIYDFWMYQFEGIDKSNGRSLYRMDDEKYYVEGTTTETAGKSKLTTDYTVIDGKPYVYNTTYAVKDWSGSAIPDLFGSFTTSFRYKGFELSGLFTYQVGGKMIDYSYNSLMSFGTSPSALHVDVLKAWKHEDASTGIDPNGIPTINTTLSTYNNATSSRQLISSDYFVVKNVTLSYAIPRKVLKPIGLNGLTLSVAGENLAIFTKKQGMNPQQSFNGTNYNAYVPARVITFGLNLNF